MLDRVLESLVPLVLGGSLLALVVGVVLTVRSQRRRTAAAAAWAQARGWRYEPHASDVHERYTGHPFGRGHSRVDEHILSGTHASRAVVCFDYRYVTTSGTGARGDRHDDTNRHAVVATELAPRDPGGPPLDVAPRGPVHATADQGDEDAVEIGAPDFDQVFAVHCANPGHARAMLGPETRALLLQRPDHRWRLDARYLMLVRTGEVYVETLDSDIGLAAVVLDSLPRGR